MNFLPVLVASIAPMIIGFIWYNPKVLGNAWMKSIGVDNPEEMKKGANMALIFGLSFFFSLLLAFALNPMVVHQSAVYAMLADIPGLNEAKIELFVNGTAVDFENKYRSFGHGGMMGLIFGILIAVPIIGTNALFERRGFKYIAINAGYWILCMTVMGGIIGVWK